MVDPRQIGHILKKMSLTTSNLAEYGCLGRKYEWKKLFFSLEFLMDISTSQVVDSMSNPTQFQKTAGNGSYQVLRNSNRAKSTVL